jgi:hemerythrin superfamily protein
MLERLLLPENHAIAILLKDHDRVKELFDRFEKAKSSATKEKIIAAALAELKIHAIVEEEIFYPAVRTHVGKDLMNEADEEHHVARVLIAELDHDGGSDDHRDAKFTVLSENVRHHIDEEEGEVLPKAKELKIDFEALGQQILERKARLQEDGIPSDAEHAMVAAARGGGDTPAAAARRHPSSKRTKSSTKKTASKRPSRRTRR